MRRVPIAISCVLAAAALGGCGNSSSSSSSAVTSTSASPTVTAGAAGLDQLRGIYAHAIADKHTAHMSTKTQTGTDPDFHTETCTVRFSPTVASDCLINRDNRQIRQISLPDTIYLSVPDATQPAGSKRWVEFDSYHTADSGNDVVQTLSQSPGSDDAVLAPGVSTVTAVASDSLGGQSVTRCDMNVNLAAMYRSEAKRTTNARLRGLLLNQANNSTGLAKAEVWIGHDSLPAQMELDVPASVGPGRQPNPAVTETISYRDWGTPADIVAPPADQVGPPN